MLNSTVSLHTNDK